MTTPIQFLVAAAILISASACARHDSSSGSDFSRGITSEPAPLPSPPSTANGSECYPNACYKTLPAEDISDPLGDYNYKDPALFPKPALRPQYMAPNQFIDLKPLNKSQSISANFVLSDVMDLSHGRYALFSAAVLSTIQKIRDELNKAVYITSGYRSPGRNGQTDGSAQWSRHMYGDALDFSSANPDYKQLQALCQKHSASFTLIYAGHIHCDWRLQTLDPAFFDSNSAPPISQKNQNFVAEQYSAQSAITLARFDSNSLTVIAQTPNLEDENDTLAYAWTAILPDGSAMHSSSESFNLPSQTGVYKISVIVGGTIAIRKELTIK